MNKRTRRDDGFTIVEITIVVAVLLVAAIALFGTMFSLSLNAQGDQTRVDISYDKQYAITSVESDVQITSSFLPTNDSTMPDPYAAFSYCGAQPAPSGCTTPTWNASGNGAACTLTAPASSCLGTQGTYGSNGNARVIILRAYSTTTNPYNNNRLPVYLGTNGSSQCNAVSKDLNTALTYNIIYFVQNGTLYRRRLINPVPTDGSQTCGDVQNEKLSCPSVETLAAAGISTRDPSCGADDEVIATGVSAFKYAAYTDCAGSSISVFGSGFNPTDNAITLAKCINLDMFITRPSGADNIQGEAELRMSSLNVGSLN